MSHAHKRYADADATTESLLLLTKKIDHMSAIQGQHGAAIACLQTDVTELKSGQSQIMGLLTKLLDGQAVLHQNDMELKRRLDERKP